MAGTPIVCQRRELATALAGNYTIEHLIDHPGVRYDLVDGEAEIYPGLHVIPTPGHVDGHQSLVAECADGSVVLAGQSHDTVSAWSADALAAVAQDLGHVEPLPAAPAWMDRLLAFDTVGSSSLTMRQCGSRLRGVAAGAPATQWASRLRRRTVVATQCGRACG
jgi:N-acyl homoserine lactone hydrolase